MIKKENRRALWTMAVLSAVWICVWLLASLQRFARAGGLKPGDPHPLLEEAPLFLFWLPLVPVVVLLARWFPLRGSHLLRNVFLHIFFSIIISYSYYIPSTMVHEYIMGRQPPGWDYWLFKITTTPINPYINFVYWVMLLTALAVHFISEIRAKERTELELKQQLLASKLEMLNSQLQPHFLYNVLSTINSLANNGRIDEITEVTDSLGGMLRTTLSLGERSLVPLHEELSLVDRYVHIMKVRFGEKLTFERDVDPACTSLQLPPLVLQTLVENAIKHGIGSTDGGSVRLHCRLTENSMIITVTDSGSGPAESASDGHGLTNIRQRLSLLFGDAGSLRLYRSEAGNGTAELLLPAIRAETETNETN